MSDSPYVFSVALDGEGGADAIDPDRSPSPHGSWLHLDATSVQAHAILEAQGIEPFIAEIMTRVESRPHAEKAGQGILIILRGINRNAGADPEDMVSIRIWLARDRMVSARLRPIRAAQTILGQLEEGRGPDCMTQLALGVIEKLADGIAEFVDDIEARMDGFEDRIEKDSSTSVRREISALRRQLAAVRRYLAPQRDALEPLCRLGGDLFDTEEIFALREQAHRITRYVEDLDLVRERALVAQEELMNHIAQQQNARTYLFSVVATIFLPITFISGVFGMNTAGLPGLEHPHAFWLVAGLMATISGLVIVWLRRKRWF